MVITSEKKKRRAPVIIAPMALVAAKVTPSSITAVRIVPKIPTSNISKIPQQVLSAENKEDVKSSMPRKTTAIPKSTHRNAGVTVIIAVKRNSAAITPIIMLAATAMPVQVVWQQQLFEFIFSPPLYNMQKSV